MIVSRLCGGLGNQMFQYAFGRQLALTHHTTLSLDISPFRTAVLRGETPRSYRLQFFSINADILSKTRAALILPFPRHLPRRLKWLPHWPGLMKTVREEGHSFNAKAPGTADDVYLDGYWQSEKYFAPHAAQIRADFALKEPMSAARQQLASQMEHGASVSVHVRRGDYITNKNALAFHGTCSPEWYAKAMSTLAPTLQHPRFFIFSDDPSWARANLPSYEGTVFIDPQPDGRDYEDMHLMAKCRHHIIANSSFSWWGAWLNPDISKKVIAPERWFLAQTDMRDRTPESWIRL